jgi:D-serine deaminase-like pyridoxal phosphate-dependent protein
VLPCLDEAEALPDVLAARPDTAAVAAACDATVVSKPRRGYRAAVDAGLLAVTADLVGVLTQMARCRGSA